MTLSVIIPTKDRCNRVADLLDSLDKQGKVDFKWEVLVIDNKSSDKTKDIVEQKIKSLSINIRYIYEEKIGLHHGRHRGAEEARGRYLGYLDDDMLLSPKWILGVKLLVDNKADAVVGKILPKWKKNPPKWLKNLTKNGTFGYLGILDLGENIKEVDPLFVHGGNSFFQKDLIFKLDGFHPDGVPQELIRYRGDGETAFMEKFKLAGYKSYYDPIATAYHIIPPDRMTLEYIYKRAYNQGISDSFSYIRKNVGIQKYISKKEDLNSFNNKINEIEHNEHKNNISFLKRLKEKTLMQIFKSTYNKIKYKKNKLIKSILYKINKRNIEYINKINIKVIEAKNKGYNFHQNEVQNDPELLKWVLKKNYFQ